MTVSTSRTDLVIALDAMGGDAAPRMVVKGADLARKHHPDVRFLMVGDEGALAGLLKRRPRLAQVTEIRHAPDIIGNDVKPTVALRTGRQSSMRLAVQAVGDQAAHCVVSAGNTGALMAIAKTVLRTVPGIGRPAIASFFPTLRGESVMLDLGANLDVRSEHLVQFAVMGSLFGKAVLGLVNPTIGVLNVGSEELKGNEVLREAAARLRSLDDLPGAFHGFVEGDDIPAGTVDVVVTDGFTGNVALKTAEGTARLYAEWLRRTFRSSIFARVGYLLARSAFKKLRRRTDPRQYNGAMFLGLRGICVKSHGGTDPRGFANAIDVAVDLVRNGFNDKVRAELEGLQDRVDAALGSGSPTAATA